MNDWNIICRCFFFWGGELNTGPRMGGDLTRLVIEFTICVWKYYKLSLSYLLQSHLFSLLCATIEISECVTTKRKISHETFYLRTTWPGATKDMFYCPFRHWRGGTRSKRHAGRGRGSIGTQLDYELFDSEQLSKSIAGDSQISHINISKAVEAAICKGMN